MKIAPFLLLLITIIIADEIEDKKLYKRLKNYDDNLTTKKIDANINKIVIKKDKDSKIDKILKEKKLKITKYTKEIKKEAPSASK